MLTLPRKTRTVMLPCFGCPDISSFFFLRKGVVCCRSTALSLLFFWLLACEIHVSPFPLPPSPRFNPEFSAKIFCSFALSLAFPGVRSIFLLLCASVPWDNHLKAPSSEGPTGCLVSDFAPLVTLSVCAWQDKYLCVRISDSKTRGAALLYYSLCKPRSKSQRVLCQDGSSSR